MSIKTYSLKKHGSTKLSEHFTVREFACSDGSDEIRIDPKLVDYLEKIRAHFGKPVRIALHPATVLPPITQRWAE